MLHVSFGKTNQSFFKINWLIDCNNCGLEKNGLRHRLPKQWASGLALILSATAVFPQDTTRHPHFVTAQLTRASAGVWIFVPSGGECIALQLANAAADARVRVRMRACGSIMCIHIAFMRMIYWHAALQVWAVPEWAGGGSSQTGAWVRSERSDADGCWRSVWCSRIDKECRNVVGAGKHLRIVLDCSGTTHVPKPTIFCTV